MALKHKWLEEAQAELNETVDYVFREFGERAAEGVYAESKDCVQRLTQFPEMGMRYKDLLFKASGEDHEGVGNLRSKSFVNLIEIVDGWSLSACRHWVPYLID